MRALITGGLVPAVVMGEGVTALGVVRSLGRKGVPQFGIGAGRSFVTSSRWYRSLPNSLPGPPSPSSLAAFLEALPFDRLVLLPCSDVWVAAVAALEPPLATRFPASQPQRETLEVLLDKGRFAEAVTRFGVPHPRTIRVGDRDDLTRVWDQAPAGAFLKPCNSAAFGRYFGIRALRVQTLAEATAFVAEARQAGLELLLQEYIPGPPTAKYFVDGFVDRTGRICARFARRTLRMFRQADFGYNSCLVSVPLAEVGDAVASLDRLLAGIHFRGIFNAQFKRDPRDGHFKILEVNPRPFLAVALATDCGVNLCEMAYRDALGLHVEPVTGYPAGRRLVHPTVDLRACWELLRNGSFSPLAWLRSWVGATHATFTWDDPVPGPAAIVEDAAKFLRRRLPLGGQRRSVTAWSPRVEQADTNRQPRRL